MQKQNGNRAAGKSKKVTGEPSVEEETDGRADRGDGRCLPLPNDVGRIQNGRVAADGRPDGRTDGLSHGRLSKGQGQAERERERRCGNGGSQAGLDWSLERE